MNGTRSEVVPLLAETAACPAEPDRSRTWRHLTLAAAACVTLLDAALLQRKIGLFTGGFLAGQRLGTAVDGAAFLMMSVVLNATIAAPLTLGGMAAGRRLGLRPPAVRFAAFCTGVLPLLIADFFTYKIWAYLGDAFDFRVMYNLTGRRVSEIVAVAAPLMSRPLFVGALAFAGLVALIWLLHRFADGSPGAIVLPIPGPALRHCLALTLLSSVGVVSVSVTSEAMGLGLRWTPAGQLFSTILNRFSDFDRDGYGLLTNPRDNAPFDPAIHPHAIDVPGNGVDEDGLAGDLPLASAVYSEPPLRNDPWPNRPPVILFVLESVRADAVGALYESRRVTPVMDRLSAEGLKVESAWSHNGFTGQSRYHILTGSLLDGRGGDTLLDDFKAHGYDVAYFSGQNDDFGGLGLDYRRIDKFYDARQDIRNRYSTSTTPGSLAVPLSVVLDRVHEYLQGRQSKAPLFLYVNFHDTHYPYTHPGLENLLGVDLLPPSQISASRRAELLRTYLNATSNVDRAIGTVISTVEAQVGQRPAIVIIGDHGESLFEQGFLGHGYALNGAQTRVPLIASGLPLTVTMPFGQAGLRRAISDAMKKGARADIPALARYSSSSRVFQYLGTLDAPSQIGWMTADGPFLYDFRSNRVSVWEGTVAPDDLDGVHRRWFEELVHTWESMLLARNQTHVAAH